MRVPELWCWDCGGQIMHIWSWNLWVRSCVPEARFAGARLCVYVAASVCRAFGMSCGAKIAGFRESGLVCRASFQPTWTSVTSFLMWKGGKLWMLFNCRCYLHITRWHITCCSCSNRDMFEPVIFHVFLAPVFLWAKQGDHAYISHIKIKKISISANTYWHIYACG